MKKLVLILILVSTSVFSSTNESIGYESFKLGMSFDEITDVLKNNYSDTWNIKYATVSGSDDLTRNSYVKMGYLLTNLKSDNITLYFSKGLSGYLSSIEILKNFENQYLTVEDFKYIRDILINKYGKPKKKYQDKYNMHADWQIDKNQVISLNAHFDSENTIFYLNLNYDHKTLAKETWDYHKNEIKTIRESILKSQSEKY